MNPIDYKPTRIDDFVGPARRVAQTIDNLVTRSRAQGTPIKLLLYGDPGVGKSSLADFLQSRLDTARWSVTKLSGTKLRLEEVEAWAAHLCYRDLFSPYKFLRIEELDRASHAARAAMLTILDDLPANVGVIATSNKTLDQMEARFLTRFQAIEVRPPIGSELRPLLEKFITPAAAARISELACGNVRQALLETQTELDSRLAA